MKNITILIALVVSGFSAFAQTTENPNHLKKTENIISWFEVPVQDFERAKKFYESVFHIDIEVSDMGKDKMGFFPSDPAAGKVSGALVKSDQYTPSQQGVVVYFNGEPDLQGFLDRVEPANGKVVMPKTLISEETGYMAFFIDTEGNKVALYSRK